MSSRTNRASATASAATRKRWSYGWGTQGEDGIATKPLVQLDANERLWRGMITDMTARGLNNTGGEEMPKLALCRARVRPCVGWAVSQMP
jgi:hypothetical protein